VAAGGAPRGCWALKVAQVAQAYNRALVEGVEFGVHLEEARANKAELRPLHPGHHGQCECLDAFAQ